MKYIYVSTYVDEKLYKSNFSQKKHFSHQMQVFNDNLVKGFRDNRVSLAIISSPPYNKSLSRKIIIKPEEFTDELICIKYNTVINIRFIRSLLNFTSIILRILLTKRENDINFLVEGLKLDMMLASLVGCKLKRFKLTTIVTDVPGFTINSNNTLFRKLIDWIHRRCISASNNLVLLNENMSEVLNINKQKICIINGLSNIEINSEMKTRLNDKFKIMYAGSLTKSNGIDKLLDAVLSMDDNIELYIFGQGNLYNQFEKLIVWRKNIFLMGQVDNSIILETQKNMDLLVNPRPVDQLFVKYSFPSKLISYICSGVSVLTSVIPGMSEELSDNVYILHDTSVCGIKNELEKIRRLSIDDISEKRLKTLIFAEKNLSCKVQVKKIIDMCEE